MRNKNAISLIVLVITIIVMLVLASAIIITLSNTNIINKAKEAVEKNNTVNNQYLSEIKLAEREIEKRQGASRVLDTTPGVLAGEGTENNPYLIESIDDLIAFSASVNGGNTYGGKTIKLKQLLDFNSDKSYVDITLKETVTTGAGFTPIGTDTNPFKGTFDGDGTEIRNLYINNNELVHVALFGYILSATIKNIGVTGNIAGSYIVSGLIAEATTGLATKYPATYIQNCYSKADVENIVYDESEPVVAGVIGIASATPKLASKIYIQDCYNAGTVTANASSNACVGGISVQIIHVEMKHCCNTGNIYAENAIELGGVSGYVGASEVYNVYNLGDIEVKNTAKVGGVFGVAHPGKIDGLNLTIYNIYNAGNIICDTTSLTNGGLCGFVENDDEYDMTLNMGNGFNVGKITLTDGSTGSVFELIGDTKDECITKKMYYISGRNLPGGEQVTNFVSKTLSEMYSQSFVDELNENIKDIPQCVKWKLGENGYPILDM